MSVSEFTHPCLVSVSDGAHLKNWRVNGLHRPAHCMCIVHDASNEYGWTLMSILFDVRMINCNTYSICRPEYTLTHVCVELRLHVVSRDVEIARNMICKGSSYVVPFKRCILIFVAPTCQSYYDMVNHNQCM